MRHITAPGVDMQCVGDCCPVQFMGNIDGYPAYWRARYDTFAFAIATEPGTLAGQVALGTVPGWHDVHYYGERGGYDAGWMPLDLAERLILEGVAAFRLARDRGLTSPEQSC